MTRFAERFDPQGVAVVGVVVLLGLNTALTALELVHWRNVVKPDLAIESVPNPLPAFSTCVLLGSIPVP